MKRIAATFLVLIVSALVAAQDYPVFEPDKLRPDEFRERRERVKRELGAGTVAVVLTNPIRNRNNDVDFFFRGDSNFLYLTGFEEDSAALVLIPDGFELDGKRVTEILFCNVPTQQSITWLGYRMGPENAIKLLGFESALPNREFEATLSKIPAQKVSLSIPPNPEPGLIGRMNSHIQAYREGKDAGPNLRQMIQRHRQVKSPWEIELLKKAAEISALAHVEAMRAVRPGMYEYEIDALYRFVFRREGCADIGYEPIVGSGPNATILHYNTNRRKMEEGDLLLVDAAGEYMGYSADVTRTFPVNGKFSPEQRAVYEIVLRAADEGIAMCRAGVTTAQIGNRISQILADGLIELGIIQSRNQIGRYYMHGFGHGIGLDVHDPMPGTLVPGVVLTVEPGIYIKEGSPCDPKWWNIGIRIEDDILVTDGEPVNLSADAPRTVADIEKLMQETGIGNQPFRPWR
ncbi:MAG: aminopeptidase P family protein [Fimbriimonadales bacterium]|nr:aminopeptidase P family protein [Fimbriimonadales bacterium]